MGLFDKKFCDVCGEKISLLGNRKVDDGNLCKDCAKKLSPWFSERRHSTIESIKEQLSYREANREVASRFQPTRTIGENYKLFIDDVNRKFTVSRSSNFAEDNPDILDFSQASGIDLKIDENRRELKRTVDGKQVSYNPPKYEYSYTFKATIFVNGNPYFDDMEFSISNGSVSTGEHNMSQGMATSGWSVIRNFATAPGMDKYQRYINIGNEMKEAIEGMRMQGGTQTQGNQYTQMGFNSQDAALVQATENMRRVEELKAIAATGTPEQLQEYLNNQQGFQPQSQPQMNMGGPNQQMQNAAPIPQAPQPETWFCTSCGSQNSGRFCVNCGAPRG
ncbi:MAG: DUF4428 domain-containing protein [Lachnospiraceae bacterium]|nr:DUF4428 domain-containing protein [Lachnospiraceae bacterium]